MSEYIVRVDGQIPDAIYERELTEIVRCRDCKRFHTNTDGFDCPKLEPNGFCAWGEKAAE